MSPFFSLPNTEDVYFDDNKSDENILFMLCDPKEMTILKVFELF